MMRILQNLTDRQTRVIMVANYAAFYSGNFIASLTALEELLTKRDVSVSYIFPKNAPFSNWGDSKGKYAENHEIHVVDFEPYVLATALRAMVRAESKNLHMIVHMHFLDWKTIATVTRILKKEKCTLIVQEHMRVDFGREQIGLSLVSRGKECIKRLFYKYAVTPCLVIGVSDAVYQDICQIRGKRTQTYMVRNAIAISRLDGQGGNVLQLDPFHDVVIFGTHFERKGVDIALKAVIKAGNDLRLIVLTHHEADAIERLDALCKEWRSYADVFHVVEDIQDVYSYALCFLSPSRSEAFGYAVVEAAYCDTQVIASNIPGQNSMKCIPDIQWVRAEDVNDLARALSYCYKMRRDHLEELKEEKLVQCAYIRSHFSVEKWCAEILKVYGLNEKG